MRLILIQFTDASERVLIHSFTRIHVRKVNHKHTYTHHTQAQHTNTHHNTTHTSQHNKHTHNTHTQHTHTHTTHYTQHNTQHNTNHCPLSFLTACGRCWLLQSCAGQSRAEPVDTPWQGREQAGASHGRAAGCVVWERKEQRRK